MGIFDKVPYTDYHNLNLDWIIEKMKELKDFMDSLPEDVIALINEIPELKEDLLLLDSRVSDLEQFKLDFLNGNFIENEIESLGKWIDENLIEFVSKIVKYVFFGLEGDYFIAYIPDSWDFITFDTGATEEDFGQLILEW